MAHGHALHLTATVQGKVEHHIENGCVESGFRFRLDLRAVAVLHAEIQFIALFDDGVRTAGGELIDACIAL